MPKPGGRKAKPNRQLLSAAGRAGPRRLLILSLAGLSVATLGVMAVTRSSSAPSLSSDAKRQNADWLPGGFNTTPEQEAVAYQAETRDADLAQKAGRSSTPRLGASVRLVDGKLPTEQAELSENRPNPVKMPPRPLATTTSPPPVYASPPIIPAAFRPEPLPLRSEPKPEVKKAQYQASQSNQRNDAQQRAYDQQMKDLLEQWNARPPHTDVVLPPPENRPDTFPGGRASATAAPTARAPDLPGIQPVVSRLDAGGQILVPAGRGIYAHPILKLSSDSGGPVVMQADSGLIAGDRLIGSFTQQGNRLVIKIENVIHRGEPISATGFVVSPDTKEAGVASDVDQNYMSRFVLPAAAAFVQGLGSAIATTSNNTAVLSPLGGATTTTNLNLNQQLGVAAGVAASNIGSTLNAAAPRGPTVTLDAGVTVGVMFLSNVTSRGAR